MFNDFDNTPGSETADTRPSRPLSITELTQRIKRLLETQLADILVEGEISGFKHAASGHIYFDLKDSGAIIKCVIWAADAARIRLTLSEGMKIEARGRLTVYDQRGQYQLRVISVRPAGLGKLYQAFMEMKEKLTSEGLFDPQHKKPIPTHPRVIGLVTSPTGAAIQDMLNILSRRAPHIHILIWPVRVQGDGAASEIAYAINRFNQLPDPVDVLIVGRGGGSMEDLWNFNEEVVARAIFESAIPIISAVGHETDTTIADYAADLRAPTPSAAAELVSRDSSQLLNQLAELENRALRCIRAQWTEFSSLPHLTNRLETTITHRLHMRVRQVQEYRSSYSLQLPVQHLNQSRQRLDEFSECLNRVLTSTLDSAKQTLKEHQSHLRTLNPKSILQRGYSITYNSKTNVVLRAADEIASGEALNIILAKGQISAVAGGALPVRKPRTRKTKDEKALDWFGSIQDEN